MAVALAASAACEEGLSNTPPMLFQGQGVSGPLDAAVPDGGPIVVLAAGIATPSSIALDSSNVYWTDEVGAVWSVPRSGGATTLLTTGQASPLGLVVDGNGYWVTGGTARGGGSVVAFRFATGTSTTLATGPGNAYSVAATPSSIFWLAQGAAGTGVDLAQVGLDGGAPAPLAALTGPAAGGGLAIDAETAYFGVGTRAGGGALFSVPLAGGPPATLWTSAAGQPTDVVLGAGAVYFLVPAASPQGAIWSVAPGAGPAALVSGLDAPAHLAIDDTSAYWTSPGDGQVYSVPLTGGTPAVVAADLVAPLALAVDDAIYVTTVDGVLKLAK